MLKLPDLEKIKQDSEHEQSGNSDAVKRLLQNMQEIKNLEQENKELKEVIRKKQSSHADSRMNALLSILDAKDKKFRDIRAQIKGDYGRLLESYTKLREHNEILISKNKSMASVFDRMKKHNEELKVKAIKAQFLLKKNFEGSLVSIKRENEARKQSHRQMMKEHEETKIAFQKETEEERKKILLLVKKHKEMLERSRHIEEENSKIKMMNRKLMEKVDYLNSHTLGNKKELERRTEIMKRDVEEKMKEMAKRFIEREVDYKSKINSLNSDLEKYFNEIKEVKERYHRREKELKEKLKGLSALLH